MMDGPPLPASVERTTAVFTQLVSLPACLSHYNRRYLLVHVHVTGLLNVDNRRYLLVHVHVTGLLNVGAYINARRNLDILTS